MKTHSLTYGELNAVSPTQQEILVHLIYGAYLRKSNLGAYAMSHPNYGTFHVRFTTVRALHRRGLVTQHVGARGKTHVVLTREGHRYANAASGAM